MRLFAEMNREQLRLAAPTSLAILPIGATEQHGPHLATGMDFLTVERITRAAAELSQAPTIVTPTLPFGSSHHHLVFGATLSLRTETYLAVLKDLLNCLVDDGFRKIYVVNGHGGNQDLMRLAVRDVRLERNIEIGCAAYWAHRGPGHAGQWETSLMLDGRPELVDLNADFSAGREPNCRPERPDFWKAINGYTDDPRLATAEYGHAQATEIIAELAAILKDFS
ncbi:MAG: creatininase family protein [Acidobacteria bacterium]|nr:creatininase family protein [Acidobacteriota bacterium]